MSDQGSRIVVIGNRNLARQILIYLLKEDWNIVGAVSAAGDAAQKQAGFESFDQIAQLHGIDIIETTDLNSKRSKQALADLKPDICICPAWHQILNKSVLNVPKVGFLGFHSSDLPRGRGGAPINWTIIHGEGEAHISLFEYVPGVDAGPILAKESVPVQARDDVSTVIDRLAVAACDTLREVREDLETATIHSKPQSIEEATYRPRRQPQDGLVDWNSTPRQITNWIRAQSDPYPGAYTFFEGQKLIIWKVMIPDQTGQGNEYAPGTVTAIRQDEGLDVAVSGGVVRIRRLQPANRPRMWADSFARRYDIEKGYRFDASLAPESWFYTGIRDGNGGTEFADATNLATGETAHIRAVIKTGRQRDVTIHARLDDQELCSEQLSVETTGHLEIDCKPNVPGTRTLIVKFLSEGTTRDTRYLKLFVH